MKRFLRFPKFLAVAGAALTLATATLPAASALAQPWHGRGGPPPPHGGWHDNRGRRGGGGVGLAVGSGIAGLAIGTMLGSAMSDRAVAPPPAYYPPQPVPPPPPPSYYSPYGYGY